MFSSSSSSTSRRVSQCLSDPFIINYHNEFPTSQLLSEQKFLSSDFDDQPSATENKTDLITVSERKSKKEVTVGERNAYGQTPKNAVPRMRSAGKTDRHSKISTAQGPRDRRMRLSLDVARKFFDLHDMLGFDTASKTVEWLFSKSKASIEELEKNHHSFTKLDSEQAATKGEDETVEPKNHKKLYGGRFNAIAKESRDKARARARRRTVEKMKKGAIEISQNGPTSGNFFNREQLGFVCRLENGENLVFHDKENGSCEKVEAVEEEFTDMDLLENQTDSISIIEELLGITSNTSSSSSIFSYSPNITASRGSNSMEYVPGMDGSIGDAQVKNPNSILRINPTLEQNTALVSVTNSSVKEPNPKPVFLDAYVPIKETLTNVFIATSSIEF